MNAKILVGLLAAFLIASGTAAAAGSQILDVNGNELPNPMQLQVGETINLSLYVENLPTTTTNVTYEVEPSIYFDTVLFRSSATGVPQTFTELDIMSFALNNNVTTGGQYQLTVNVRDTDTGAVVEDMTIKATATHEFVIPEFPTVALPIAAILGIAFFLQRRREE